jgi:4-amino-4-deoxy-L-arabinose transferase-like glycosyltransferase
LAGLFLLALIPRLGLAMYFLETPIGLDDMFQYDMLARSLASGHGYRWYQRADVARLKPYLDQFLPQEVDLQTVPEKGMETIFRAPGYPAFLAVIYKLAGFQQRLPWARLIQAILGALVAPLTALLGLRLSGQRAAALAGMVVAFYPILAFLPVGLASENLFIPLLMLSLLAMTADRAARQPSIAILSGLALGAATLTRGSLVLFLPLAWLWLWRFRSPRHALLCTLTCSALLLPWAARNSRLAGRPAFVENTAGFNLYVGYHPQGDGTFFSQAAVELMSILDDSQRDAWATQQALGFIRQHPGRIPRLLLRRLAALVGWEDRELRFFYSNNFFGPIPQPWLAILYAGLVIPWMVVALSAPFGLAALHDREARGLILALVAATLLAYLPILGSARFHLPLVPPLAVCAAVAWTQRGPSAATPDAARPTPWRWPALTAATLVALWAWDLILEWEDLMALMGPGGHQTHFPY